MQTERPEAEEKACAKATGKNTLEIAEVCPEDRKREDQKQKDRKQEDRKRWWGSW